MNKNLLNRIYRFALLLGLLYPATLRAQVVGDPQLAAPAAQPLPSKSSSKVSSDLVELQNDYQAAGRRRSGRSGFEPENSLLQVVGDRVVIDAVARGDVQALRAELERRGMTVTAVYGRVVSGLMPITSIREMESVGGLQFASPAYRPATNIGAVTSQGDSSMRGGIARRRFGVDGLGNKIGVMSNSYNLLGGADAGVRSGDLPGPGNPNGYTTPVQVLREFPGTLTQAIDEGRGMAELVHDVAPGAQMAFRTAFLGQADFAQGITELANAGCNIIVDDVIYFAEPFFQDGIIAQSVDAAQARGVTYLSSAGNQARASYESEYRPSTVEFLGAGNGTAHNFSAPGAAPRYNQPVFIPRGGQAIFSFQWDDSFFSATGVGAQSDLDIYLLDSLGTVVAGSAANNLLSGEPVEIFGYTNNTPRQTFFLVILKFAGPDPRRLKYINFGSGAFFLTNPAIPGILSSTLVGHANAAGAIATGASFALQTPAYGVTPPRIESFSALGGTPILRNLQGNAIGPVVRPKPEVTGPDGGNTTFFGQLIPQDGDQFPNFFGTSAAAPHVAAVAALMLEANKLNVLTPTAIKGVLQLTAVDMDDPNTPSFDAGFDFRTGFGLVNAETAVQTVNFTPAFIQNLNLTSLCSARPDSTRRWRIRNPNPFNVRVTWEVFRTSQRNTVIAPPGDSFFETVTVPGSPNTTIISWVDEKGKTKRNTKASSGARCGGGREGAEEILAATADGLELLTAYPNPFSGRINLLLVGDNAGPVDVRVFDGKGSVVYNRRHAPETGNSEIALDTESLPSGLYMVQVNRQGQAKTLKVVKQ